MSLKDSEIWGQICATKKTIVEKDMVVDSTVVRKAVIHDFYEILTRNPIRDTNNMILIGSTLASAIALQPDMTPLMKKIIQIHASSVLQKYFNSAKRLSDIQYKDFATRLNFIHKAKTI
jgi:hypothetical protein